MEMILICLTYLDTWNIGISIGSSSLKRFQTW